MTARLIVVSGPPGAGKTTLAHLVARGVGCPAICRDEIREGVVHAGTPDDDMRLTYRIFLETVSGLVAAGVTVVAEAAFQDHLWRPLLEVGDVRVIRCVVPPEVAAARIAARGDRPAHPGRPVGPSEWVPIAADVPTLVVDSVDGWSPELAEVVAFAGG